MEKLTYKKFYSLIKEDPSWASRLTEPIEVIEYCAMENINITHLSPLLYFTGKNHKNEVATFAFCYKLKVAEGNFDGFVNFEFSRIEKIGDLNITQASTEGNAVDFNNCPFLRIATGTYPGLVCFGTTGIEKIENLFIKSPNIYGIAALFYDCCNLRVARGNFPGDVDFSSCGIEAIQDFQALSGSFTNCKYLKRIPKELLNESFQFDPRLTQKWTEIYKIQDSIRNIDIL